MSPRELMVTEFVEWVMSQERSTGGSVFNAPYGVLSGLEKGNKARGVTFGVARISDIHVSIYGPKFVLMRDSRYGQAKFDSMEALKSELRKNYGLKEKA